MIPLRDNIPTDRFPVVTLGIIVVNFLVFLSFQGLVVSLSSGQEVDAKPIVEYGAIPYRISHPGKKCVLAVPGTPAEQPACEGTEIFREALQADPPPQKISQPPAFLRIITSMFRAVRMAHIAFNMLFLGVFGKAIRRQQQRNWLVSLADPRPFEPSPVFPSPAAMHTVATPFGDVTAALPIGGSCLGARNHSDRPTRSGSEARSGRCGLPSSARGIRS